MEVYLLRHTSVAVEKHFCYGISEVPLGDTFPQEVAVVRDKLPPNIEDFHIASSPLQRCRLLAEELAENFIIDERLIEFNFGAWEQKSWKNISRDEFAAWTANIAENRVPGGDRLDEFQERVVSFWRDLINAGHEKAVLVAHTGTIHALLAYLLHMPLEYMFTLNVDYGGLSLIGRERGRFLVQYINR